MTKSNEFDEYIVAFLDILGFKKFIFTYGLIEANTKMRDLINSLSHTRNIGSLRFTYGNGTSNIVRFLTTNFTYFMFSDSVLIYKKLNERVHPEVSVFTEMVSCLEKIFQKAFKLNLHIRVGVAAGEAKIALDDAGRDNILIGEPIINAYQVEQAQNWMGCAFHNSCENFLSDTETALLIPYKIPLKSNTKKTILNHTVRWIDINLSLFEGNFDDWKTERRREKKIKSNTIRFFKKFKHSEVVL